MTPHSSSSVIQVCGSPCVHVYTLNLGAKREDFGIKQDANNIFSNQFDFDYTGRVIYSHYPYPLNAHIFDEAHIANDSLLDTPVYENDE